MRGTSIFLDYLKVDPFNLIMMKTKEILFLLFSFLVIHSIHGQTRSLLTGKVTGEDNVAPLAGATIRVHDVNRDAISNESGEYKTSFLPAGVYLVEVSHVGYGSIIETVVINGDTRKDFILKDCGGRAGRSNGNRRHVSYPLKTITTACDCFKED